MKFFRLLLFTQLLTGTTTAQTKSQKVNFPFFSIRISNFYSECYHYARFAEENEKPPVFYDTLFICETPCDENGWYVNGQIIGFSSKTRGNNYELSYAVEYTVRQEANEPVRSALDEKKYLSAYKVMKPLKGDNFRLPQRNRYLAKADLLSAKTRFGIRDTLVEISGETGIRTFTLTKNGKLFSFDSDNFILKIKRFVSGKLKETKYLVIGLSEGCE